MKTRTFIIGIALTALTLFSCQKEPVRIACIGDSITYGHGIADREHDTYPAIMDSLLGDRYDVRNFGISGSTLMNSGDMPYMKEQAYQDVLDFMPDIVTIALGTNDSKPRNWISSQYFKDDLKLLINNFKSLESDPEIWLCLPTPVFSHAWTINDSVISNGVIPYIIEVAQEMGLRVIDLNAPFQSESDYFSDTTHPNEAGQQKIADIILSTLDIK